MKVIKTCLICSIVCMMIQQTMIAEMNATIRRVGSILLEQEYRLTVLEASTGLIEDQEAEDLLEDLEKTAQELGFELRFRAPQGNE